jgi:DNA uptake protein ComE-like DNA-binding protein
VGDREAGSPVLVETSAECRVLALGTVCLAGAILIGAHGQRGAPATEAPLRLVVDANAVPVTVLEALPRIGPARARAIDAERRERPFASLAELQARVSGIGPATAAGLEPHVRFGTEPLPVRPGRVRAAD